MGKFETGQAIRRKEDERVLTGTVRYTDDILLPEQPHLFFLILIAVRARHNHIA